MDGNKNKKEFGDYQTPDFLQKLFVIYCEINYILLQKLSLNLLLDLVIFCTRHSILFRV